MVPALPFIMLSTGATAVVGLVAHSAGWLLGWMAWPALTYLISAVLLFDRFPLAVWSGVVFPSWAVLASYAGLAAAVWLYRLPAFRRLARRRIVTANTRQPIRPKAEAMTNVARWAILPLLAVSISAWGAVSTLPDGRLRVAFLDVGTGDAALISTPDGKHILIDGGPDPQRLKQQLGANLPYWERDIDLVVLTHPHSDHVTGLVSIMDSYRVKEVLQSVQPYDSAVYVQWSQRIKEQHIPVVAATTGQQVELGRGVQLTVEGVGSGSSATASSDPDQSVLVLRLTWGTTSFLFTADAEQETERELIEARSEVNTTVLKVGHHGSDTSTTPEFLAVAKPSIAVVSVGANNGFNFPRPDVMDRLTAQVGAGNLYTTSDRGTVVVTTDGDKLWVATER
jgi:competence protein ComEC